jgi:hypothetical protein
MARPHKVALIFAYWGEWYSDKFIRFTLPSLLSAQNVRVLTTHFAATIRIGTLRRQLQELEQAPVFAELRRIFRCELVAFDDELADFKRERDAKYTLWAHMLNHLKRGAADAGEDFFLLHGDSVYPRSFFGDLHALISGGADLVYTVGIRCDDLKYEESSRGVDLNSIDARGFDELMLAAEHFFITTQYFDSPIQSRWPCDVLFRLEGGGAYARVWTMHPIFIRRAIGKRPITVNIDVDYDLEITRRLAAKGQIGKIAVLSGSGRYFISLTDREDSWLKHVIRSGDGHDELDYFHPADPAERTDLLCQWIDQYVPFKSLLAFKEEFLFCPDGIVNAEELASVRAFCDGLFHYGCLFDRRLVDETGLQP